MKPSFVAETVNTVHWISTGIFYVNKRGEKKEKKRKVVHRRLFLTALPDAVLIGLPRNIRIVQVRRHGEITYSLSCRKEKGRSWWEKDAAGNPLPPIVDKDYTRLKDSEGREEKPMKRDAAEKWLKWNLGSEDAAWSALWDLDNGEPLEGDSRWDALCKYGYERPEYEDEEENIAA